jgi:hypothetical protein
LELLANSDNQLRIKNGIKILDYSFYDGEGEISHFHIING